MRFSNKVTLTTPESVELEFLFAGKRLGDLAAGTLVIQEEYQVAATSFPVSPQAQELATQLPQMANLS